jgi:outer membrane protein
MKDNWKFVMGFMVAILITAIVAPGIARAAGSTVGVIDLEKAVTAHPAYDSKMSDFDAYKTQQNARLDVYRNKDVLTDDDKDAIVNLRREIDTNVANKYAELFDPLTDDVIAAVKKVGDESGIEAILDAQVVLYGGLDLTPAVINELKGK